MKEYYKIKEISDLYGIGIDSLRYYEKLGILCPSRDANGYRLYDLKELYKLNIIRDLRNLNFSMQQIKEYLDNQSVQNTLNILNEEEKIIAENLKILRKRKKIIKERMNDLKKSMQIAPGLIRIEHLPERSCIRFDQYITRDEEMDYIIKKIHHQHEHSIFDLGDQTIGAFIAMEDVKNDLRNVYYSVFFILKNPIKQADFLLPEGEYVTCHYQGEYEQNLDRIREAIHYAEEAGYQTIGDPFEIYEIDNRTTMQAEEFLTAIQIPVKKFF